MANAGDVAPDNEKINSQRLMIALLKLENFLGGRAVIDTILISLKGSGINLDDETKSYSLDELEEGLRKIIGEASVFVIARLKEVH